MICRSRRRKALLKSHVRRESTPDFCKVRHRTKNIAMAAVTSKDEDRTCRRVRARGGWWTALVPHLPVACPL